MPGSLSSTTTRGSLRRCSETISRPSSGDAHGERTFTGSDTRTQRRSGILGSTDPAASCPRARSHDLFRYRSNRRAQRAGQRPPDATLACDSPSSARPHCPGRPARGRPRAGVWRRHRDREGRLRTERQRIGRCERRSRVVGGAGRRVRAHSRGVGRDPEELCRRRCARRPRARLRRDRRHDRRRRRHGPHDLHVAGRAGRPELGAVGLLRRDRGGGRHDTRGPAAHRRRLPRQPGRRGRPDVRGRRPCRRRQVDRRGGPRQRDRPDPGRGRHVRSC